MSKELDAKVVPYKSLAEITIECGKRDEAILQKQVKLRNGSIIISIENEISEYDVDLSRCSNVGELLDWVRHLAGKPWMNTRVLCRVIDLVCKENKIKIPYA